MILESTTYPGTTEEVLLPVLEQCNANGLKAVRGVAAAERSFYFAFSPKREDPGNTAVLHNDIPKLWAVYVREPLNWRALFTAQFSNALFEFPYRLQRR